MTGIRVRGAGVNTQELEEAASNAVVAIVRAPLGNGAGVFAPNIKLGLFEPRALGSRRARDVNRSPLECGMSYSHLRKQVLWARRVLGEPRLLCGYARKRLRDSNRPFLESNVRFGRGCLEEGIREGVNWDWRVTFHFYYRIKGAY